MSKFQDWYDSLSPSTKEYLKNQPIWHDSDLFKFSTIAFLVGFILGKVL